MVVSKFRRISIISRKIQRVRISRKFPNRLRTWTITVNDIPRSRLLATLHPVHHRCSVNRDDTCLLFLNFAHSPFHFICIILDSVTPKIIINCCCVGATLSLCFDDESKWTALFVCVRENDRNSVPYTLPWLTASYICVQLSAMWDFITRELRCG